jgi:hypothetical protein
MPKPEKAMVVLCAPSDIHWVMLNSGSVAVVMGIVALPVDEAFDALVTVQLKLTDPVVPGMKEMLFELLPTMIVPLVMLHEYVHPVCEVTDAAYPACLPVTVVGAVMVVLILVSVVLPVVPVVPVVDVLPGLLPHEVKRKINMERMAMPNLKK